MSESEATERAFMADGEGWLARPAGEGAIGSGRVGSGSVAAVHFFLASEPTRPLREGLVPRGRFAGLFEAELVELWAGATPIEPAGTAARSETQSPLRTTPTTHEQPK